MTELAIREESAIAVPAPQLPVPAVSDLDSWVNIVGKIVKLANEIYDTPFVPDGLRGSAPAVAAAMLAGREMGLGPMTSLANIDVIRGKPTQKPLLMRAMILSRGHRWDDVEVSDTRAVVRGRRKDETDWTTVTFTADQARKAGLDLGKYPADKLYARASSRLARHKFADVIMGMAYSSDDVEDGLDVEDAADAGRPAPAVPAAPPAEPRRTAQRRKPPESRPTAAGTSAASRTPATSSDGNSELPPLPGEDEEVPTSGGAATSDTDRPSGGDSSDPVSNTRLTAIWTTLTKDFEVTSDDGGKEEARAACGIISGRGANLGSTKHLTNADASVVLDTLARLKHQAAERDTSPRQLLIALLAEREEGAGGGE